MGNRRSIVGQLGLGQCQPSRHGGTFPHERSRPSRPSRNYLEAHVTPLLNSLEINGAATLRWPLQISLVNFRGL